MLASIQTCVPASPAPAAVPTLRMASLVSTSVASSRLSQQPCAAHNAEPGPAPTSSKVAGAKSGPHFGDRRQAGADGRIGRRQPRRQIGLRGKPVRQMQPAVAHFAAIAVRQDDRRRASGRPARRPPAPCRRLASARAEVPSCSGSVFSPGVERQAEPDAAEHITLDDGRGREHGEHSLLQQRHCCRAAGQEQRRDLRRPPVVRRPASPAMVRATRSTASTIAPSNPARVSGTVSRSWREVDVQHRGRLRGELDLGALDLRGQRMPLPVPARCRSSARPAPGRAAS